MAAKYSTSVKSLREQAHEYFFVHRVRHYERGQYEDVDNCYRTALSIFRGNKHAEHFNRATVGLCSNLYVHGSW